ncbi:hypothetical protein ENUP19_0071G0052 [Entamoeba nuttalli]|uniref:Uncharacterized protein n=2 Tax=Entamoeba nuttalli TaxID=412467 RepID=K2HG81_ENTNP|nr:hypothetical protein ENU1_040830 [Entamoeba nuttalli P19]EKE41894.1 hypothetical protein ENU1_040830 [Entamoeba nuttalli P19]|eukprot:XP_008855770.1 hypothetical protein ENU1_040830 [Entamoeba nuttalli P19]
MYPFLNIPPSYPNHGYSIYRHSDPYQNNYSCKIPERSHLYAKNIKPPQIALSSQTIYRFRSFTLTLTVSEDWRIINHLRPEDVIKAVMSATCHKESAIENHLNDEVKSCKVCQSDRRIIEIDHCDQNQIGPVTTQDGLEKYTFNKCKSYCSSSRSHHHSRLCLVINGLPGGPYYSAPFVLQAREKRSIKPSLDELKLTENKQQLSVTSEERDIHTIKEDGLDLNEESGTEVIVSTKNENVVVILLYMNNIDIINQISEHFTASLKKIDGVITVKTKAQNKNIYFCVFIDKDESLEKVTQYTNDYIKNNTGSENGFNANLLTIGIIRNFLISDSKN